MNIDDIRAKLHQREDNREPHIRASLGIIDVFTATDPRELAMWSWTSFRRILADGYKDEDIQKALDLLSSPEYGVLSEGAMLQDEDGNEFDICAADLAEAKEEGDLIHPETGEPVEDYENFLVPYWAARESFLEGHPSKSGPARKAG